MAKLEILLNKLPTKPGVYKYLNSKQEIIYVGKAKNLKKRVKSYFQQNKNQGPKTAVMVAQIDDIQYTVVDSELEAIMLETNLIKELKPKYNILMKDDKNFIYIKVTTNEDFPKIYLVRKIQKDKATYIGPKTSGFDIKSTAKLLSSLLPYPKCQINIESIKTNQISKQKQEKPLCIFKTIDPNHTPCISHLKQEEYKEVIQKIIQFFQGKHIDLLKKIQEQMTEFANSKEFEKAAQLRDKLISLQKIIEKQKISGPTEESLDVIDIIYADQQYFANLFQIREGHLISQNNFILPSSGLTEGIATEMSEVFTTFIQQYYSNTEDFPKKILIPEPLENVPELENWLSKLKGNNVKIQIPQVGKKHQLIELANKNAIQYAKLMRIKWMSNQAHNSEQTLPELAKILNLSKSPKRIECYDISHLQGNHTVGSMIVFEKGQAKKEDYRYFNLRNLNGKIDDFASLQEVLTRRLKYLNKLPIEFQVKKQKNTYSCIKKTTKKIIFTIQTEIQDDNLILKIPKKIPNQKLNLFESFLHHIINTNKQKKYLIKDKDPNNKSILLNLGFIEIDNSNYNLGFYKQKQNIDKSFNQKPDLIIIDGGKGQLSAALKAKKSFQSNIPFISIAKKLEELFTDTNQHILLPHTSPVLHLIQQMRNEAHRFAITKNRKDRIKNMLNKKSSSF